MDQQTKFERLNHLLDVALIHKEYDGHDTPLNGGRYDLNMGSWVNHCTTSACLLGSYTLTDYGKRFFKWSQDCCMPEPELRENSTNDPYQDAAEHFDLTPANSMWLFNPDRYAGCPRTDEGRIPPAIVAKRVEAIIERERHETPEEEHRRLYEEDVNRQLDAEQHHDQ